MRSGSCHAPGMRGRGDACTFPVDPMTLIVPRMSHPPETDRWPPRPRVSSRFYKGHGLGNDYLVFETADGEGRGDASSGDRWVATPGNVARVCDPHRGLGSDGIVVVRADEVAGPELRVALRMFNPDGGEFERSGNGLRVLASYLAMQNRQLNVIDAEVGGGEVRMHVHDARDGVFDVSVDMGRAHTGPEAIEARTGLLSGSDAPYAMAGPHGEELRVVPVSVGNPHLVVLADEEGPTFGEDTLTRLGPFLATHPDITHGTNVQLARVSAGRAEACIWERGVGRTSASGTSSCAVAVALVLVGVLAPGDIPVDMPGGCLTVTVGRSLDVVLRGPVESVMTGTLEAGLLATFERGP